MYYHHIEACLVGGIPTLEAHVDFRTPKALSYSSSL
jgi:hypothetical protein